MRHLSRPASTTASLPRHSPLTADDDEDDKAEEHVQEVDGKRSKKKAKRNQRAQKVSRIGTARKRSLHRRCRSRTRAALRWL